MKADYFSELIVPGVPEVTAPAGDEGKLTLARLSPVSPVKNEKVPKTDDQRAGSVRAAGYGCGRCGNRVYRQVTVWETQPLPPGGDWQYEHRPAMGWQCEQCGMVYEVIGGSRGPVYIH